MELFPAIDLRDGKVVRLTQGDYDRMEVYADNPAGTAVEFRKQGAKNLHVVDLDGAKDGTAPNFDAVRAIVEQSGLFVQVGGGIRSAERVEQYLNLGVGRVILGTAAIENPEFLCKMADQYGERIAVGVDARDGLVAVRGWRETTGIDAFAFCKELEQVGISTIIYTDIAKDGAMQGTNLEAYRKLSEQTSCQIIASGGISALDELSQLQTIGTYGAILGKALYIGAFTLKEALAYC